MALTQSLLKSLGIESEQRDAIMAAHQDTLESIKRERDELRDKAAKVPDLEGQIEALKAADESEEWKAKYEQATAESQKLKSDADKLQSEFDALKAEAEKAKDEHEKYVQKVDAEKADAEKLELYKGLLREIGLDEKRVELAASVKNLDELAVVDGKLDGYDELKASEADTWEPFIPKPSGVHGQKVPNPPKSEPTTDGADPEITKMLQQRHAELYGSEGKTTE